MYTVNMIMDTIECVITGVSKTVWSYMILVPFVYLLYDFYISMSYLYMSKQNSKNIKYDPRYLKTSEIKCNLALPDSCEGYLFTYF